MSVDINSLTIGEAKTIAQSIGFQPQTGINQDLTEDNGMIGKYVIVRCRDAGVHAGYLESHHGRDCILLESRRLWYWQPKKGAFLSGVAVHGLDDSSKIGAVLQRIHLTENCEIIMCSDIAAKSIQRQVSHNE